MNARPQGRSLTGREAKGQDALGRPVHAAISPNTLPQTVNPNRSSLEDALFCRRIIFIFMLLTALVISVFIPGPARAGAVYSSGELMALGELWVETRVQWQFEEQGHDRRMKKIGGMNCSDMKKDLLFNREMTRHRNRSNILAAKRDQVQNALIIESNARVKGGKQPVSGRLKDSLGTKFGDKGHRGMVGDRDMGAGARTTEKVKSVLQDMGLYNPKNPERSLIVLNENAATLEIKGDFELTINKQGLRPKAGTAFHQVQVDVNARNPETFVSESMRVRENGRIVRQQVGTEYVEVQDHITKANPGLTSSGDELVRNPGRMQTVSKGAYKTLDLGRVDDRTLERILKQNGIKGGPAQFKKQLRHLYRGAGGAITDPKQAERIRRATEDIFSAAEKATLRQAKIDIADVRKKAASLPPNDPVRMKIEDELVDSVTKMKRTKAVNDEFLSRGLARTRPGLPPDPPTPRKAITPAKVEAEVKGLETPSGGQARQRAAKCFGFVMGVADIGQACQAVEDYLSGKKSLADTTIHFVDQFTLGVISSGRAIYQKGDDFWETKKKTDYANQQNMNAFLTQWEVRLRQAGVSPTQARRLVGNAVLSGDLELLKRKARILRAQGREIQDPQLVSETFHMDDYVQDLKDTAWGAGKGVVEGVAYPILAPYRTLKAYQEGGELAVAQMDAYAKEHDATSRSALFQKLVAAGAPARRALRALNDYEDNQPGPLRALFGEIKAKQKAQRTQAEAEAKAARREAAALAQRLGKLLPQYNAYVTYLLTAALKLDHAPDPAELKPDNKAALIRLSLEDPKDRYLQAAKGLEELLTELSGSPARVYLDYKFSCPGKPGRTPNIWYTNSPRAQGIYPVSGEVWVDVRGNGLSGPLSILQRNFVREAFAQVKVVGGKDQYTGEIWQELRKTKVTTIYGYGGYFTATGQVGAARSISFEFQARRLPGRAEIKVSADGKRIEKLFVEYTKPGEKGYAQQRARFTIKNMRLHSLDPETASKPTKAYYVMDDKHLEVTVQTGNLGQNGKWEWGQPRKEEWKGSSMSVFFEMDDQAQALKKKARKERSQAKEDVREAQKKKAQGGRQFSGPMGRQEGYKGNIEINLGRGGRSVHGKFKSFQKRTVKGEKASACIRGEFMGAYDPKTRQLTAQIIEGGSGMSCFNSEYKKWFSCGEDEEWADKAQIIGELKKGAFSGWLVVDSKKRYAWTADEAKPRRKSD